LSLRKATIAEGLGLKERFRVLCTDSNQWIV
jgi:hypothetical protein